MPVGEFTIVVEGADELKRALLATERGMKDLSKANRAIGKMAGDYVKAHEPLPSYDFRKNSRVHPEPGYLQRNTKGGGGKTGAYVEAQAPYIFVQEFGGSSFWHKQGRGAIRSANRAHKKMSEAASAAGVKGHIIYKKPRRSRGYFIWNVAYRLRTRIGTEYMNELQHIAAKNGLDFEVLSRDLGIEELPPPTRG